MPDDDKNIRGSLVLDFGISYVRCILSLARLITTFGIAYSTIVDTINGTSGPPLPLFQ